MILKIFLGNASLVSWDFRDLDSGLDPRKAFIKGNIYCR